MPEYTVTWEGYVLVDATVDGTPVVIDMISALIPENQWMGRLVTDLTGPLVLANRNDSTPVLWSNPIMVPEPSVAFAFTLLAGAMILVAWVRRKVRA